MTVELTADVRTRLDAHLDAVEDALRSTNRTREQRSGIVDDLEAQILDVLANNSGVPTLADLDAVLQKLDPPAAYREGAAPLPAMPPQAPAVPPQPSKPRYSRTAIWGLVVAIAGMLPVLTGAAVWIYTVIFLHDQSIHEWNHQDRQFFVSHIITPMMAIIAVFAVPLMLTATVLGWIAFFQIRSSRGTLRGTGLAIFDGLLYPVLATIGVGLFMS